MLERAFNELFFGSSAIVIQALSNCVAQEVRSSPLPTIKEVAEAGREQHTSDMLKDVTAIMSAPSRAKQKKSGQGRTSHKSIEPQEPAQVSPGHRIYRSIS